MHWMPESEQYSRVRRAADAAGKAQSRWLTVGTSPEPQGCAKCTVPRQSGGWSTMGIVPWKEMLESRRDHGGKSPLCPFRSDQSLFNLSVPSLVGFVSFCIHMVSGRTLGGLRAPGPPPVK